MVKIATHKENTIMPKEIPASNREEKYLDIGDDEFFSRFEEKEEKLDTTQPQANTAAKPVSPAPAKENIPPNQPDTTKPTPPKEPKNSKRKHEDLSSTAPPSNKAPSWVTPADDQVKQDKRLKVGK